MTGLAINIHIWKHLLLRVEFNCAVDHSALPYIMKSKNLPATGRIVRLLEQLSGYSFNLYFVKGKDMILCDYLSRIDVDRGDPSEVIPISFNALAQYRLALDYAKECFIIMFLTNSFVATAGTNTRNTTFKIVHSDLLNKTWNVHQQYENVTIEVSHSSVFKNHNCISIIKLEKLQKDSWGSYSATGSEITEKEQLLCNTHLK